MQSTIAIGFDFDHTLGVDNKLERTVALEMLQTLARSHDITYDVAAAETTIDEVLAGYRNSDQAVEAAIAGFFERFAPSGSAVMDSAGDFRDNVVARVAEFVTPLPGAQELLAELDAQGVRYALLTNGWSPLQEEKARLIGFRGSVFVSERVSARKPAREAFDLLAKHFDAAPADVWYVGDDPLSDIAGAADYGMTTVWYDWEGLAYPAGIARPSYTISALGELPALLQGRVSGAANSRG